MMQYVSYYVDNGLYPQGISRVDTPPCPEDNDHCQTNSPMESHSSWTIHHWRVTWVREIRGRDHKWDHSKRLAVISTQIVSNILHRSAMSSTAQGNNYSYVTCNLHFDYTDTKMFQYVFYRIEGWPLPARNFTCRWYPRPTQQGMTTAVRPIRRWNPIPVEPYIFEELLELKSFVGGSTSETKYICTSKSCKTDRACASTVCVVTSDVLENYVG